MKKILYLLFAATVLISCGNGANKKNKHFCTNRIKR